MLSALLLALALFPAAASAETTIGFDNLAADTQLAGQYAAEGVSFGEGPGGGDEGEPLIVVKAPFARSAPNVAEIPCGETCRRETFIDFAPTVEHMSVYVASTEAGSIQVKLTAFDSDGEEIATDSGFAEADSFTTRLAVAAPAGKTIAFADIEAPESLPDWAIDDLSFGSVSPPASDFGLIPAFSSGGVGLQGGSSPASASITLRRFNGSTGQISFSHSSLPPGVDVTVSPNPDTEGDRSTITATFTAEPNAPSVAQFPVTITGTPAPSAGSVTHSVAVPVTVQSTYGLRVQGIEVNQGIQTFTLPVRNPASPSAPVPYSGVQLIGDMPTVVRVYADAPNAPPGGVQGATMLLAADNDRGEPLAGSPIAAVSTPNEANGTDTLIESGSANVPLSERENASGSYDFDLPTGWIAEASSLTATLLPPTGSFSGPTAAVPCTDAACTVLRSFTLGGLSTVYPGTTAIDTVELAVNGSAPNPYSPFYWAERLMPANVFPDEDAGSIDISWIMKGCPIEAFGKKSNLCEGRAAQNGATLSAVEDFASNYDNGQGPAMAGVTTENLGVEDGNTFGSLGGGEPVAVVESSRPVTDVMHEIGHMFGLAHASQECGGGQDNDNDDQGQNGESWPPDQEGYIDGIGLDVAAGTAPYPVVSGPGRSSRSLGTEAGECSPNQNPPECGIPNPQQFFDFMDYCTQFDPNYNGTLGSSNAWISVRNWDYIATYATCLFNGGGGLVCALQAKAAKQTDASEAASQQANAASVRHDASPLATEASGAGMVRVYGYSIAGKTSIALVDPTPSRRRLSGTVSNMQLVLQGQGSRILSRAPLLQSSIHVDGYGPMEFLQGAVPERAGASAVAILENGKVLAKRLRPPHIPRVKLLAPRHGQRLRGAGPILVRWHVSDPDRGVHLIVSVDFSSDNGRIWRTAYSGANTGRASIPRSLLRGSTSERVRVRVSDLFDQVTVLSGRFALQAAPPRVSILAPTSAAAIHPGATLLLSGTAVDDAGHTLSGASLTWLSGTTVLGTGTPLFATLPAGATSITLRARDSAGRTAQVTLPPPPPKPKKTKSPPHRGRK